MASSAHLLAAPAHGVNGWSVEQLDRSEIRIVHGKQALELDLGGDTPGCHGETFDPIERKRWKAEVPIELVDEAENPPFFYLVLLAQTASNCNIQGACGASRGESTLIWLKLTRDLTLAAKQAVLFDSCIRDLSAQIEAAAPGEEVDAGFSAKDLRWTGDVLRIEVESERTDGRRWRLTYDRHQPEAGLDWVERERAPSASHQP